jgi:hypothetical protein
MSDDIEVPIKTFMLLKDCQHERGKYREALMKIIDNYESDEVYTEECDLYKIAKDVIDEIK